MEQLKAERQEEGALPVGEESEVADAYEAAWQQMEQESAQKLLDIQSHEPVSPTERNLAIGKSDESVVGDGDAVSVGAEIT